MANVAAITRIITGTPSSVPLPMKFSFPEKPEIARPSAMYSAPPRAMDIMPSVAINAGRFTRVTSRPLTRPHTPPVSTQPASAAPSGTPLLSMAPSRMPANATTEPTDRSMPPVMTTIIMPIARIPLTAACFQTFSRLRGTRKVGDTILSTMMTARKMTIRPKSRANALGCMPFGGFASFFTGSICCYSFPNCAA